MYQENRFKTFNIWRDGDLLHIFLTVPSKKYNQYLQTIEFVKQTLRLDFELEFDDNQFYFVLTDFDEYKEFKEYFFRYLCCFPKKEENKNEN